MVDRTHIAFKATDRSYFAILKKEIHAIAIGAGFSVKRMGELDIIVAELVSNLVKHAGGGQLLVKLIENDGIQGMEIISMDDGMGMTDVSRMVADGISTKNTLGQGLGAMKRLSDFFQVYSLKDWGTIILIRIFDEALPLFKKPARWEAKSVILPKPGETACGDGFFCTHNNDQIKLFLGDGLGHGPEAAKAVLKAGEAFLENEETDAAEMIRHINNSVKKTRGLVGTVALFNLKEKLWQICGIGNIATKLIGPGSVKNYMSYNGIIGLNVPNSLSVQEVPYENGQYLLMCSDGIKSRWDTVKYPAILRYDPTIVAASLVKDYNRNTDDVSVVTCKINL